MRLLLDECVPARLGRSLPSHQVSTVVREGWSGIKIKREALLVRLALGEIPPMNPTLPASILSPA